MTEDEYREHVRRIAWDAIDLTGDRKNTLINAAVDTATAGLSDRWNSAMGTAVRVLWCELREARKVYTPPGRVVMGHGSRLTKLKRAGQPDKGTALERRRSIQEREW